MQICQPRVTVDCLPFTSRVVGIPPTVRELQSTANPLGEADGIRLNPISRWTGQIGCAGEQWIIRGHVQMVFSLVAGAGAGAITPRVIGDDEQGSCAAPVKLRYQRCKFPGWTIIDADSVLVVPGGEDIEIDVLVPSTWLLLPTTQTVELPNTFQFVDVRVTACRCDCGLPPPGFLGWWNNAMVDLDTVVRPRRARRLQISTPNPGGATFAWWNGNPLTPNAILLGTFQINGGFVNTDLIPGSASHLQLTGGAGVAAPFRFVWEIG